MDDRRDPSGGWNVHLSVTPDEAQALLAATPGLVEGGASLVRSPGGEVHELVLFSREDEERRARESVVDIYQRVRRAAGLDAEAARVVSLERPSRKGRRRSLAKSLHVTLLQQATRVLESESHFEWVVVLAQTACEVYVRDILDRRAGQLGADVTDRVKRLPGANLDNEAVRRLFLELTGYMPPQEQKWWRDYQAHAQRRHRIVHAGARITRKEAEQSIEAVKALIEFLHWPASTPDPAR